MHSCTVKTPWNTTLTCNNGTARVAAQSLPNALNNSSARAATSSAVAARAWQARLPTLSAPSKWPQFLLFWSLLHKTFCLLFMNWKPLYKSSISPSASFIQTLQNHEDIVSGIGAALLSLRSILKNKTQCKVLFIQGSPKVWPHKILLNYPASEEAMREAVNAILNT